MTEIKANYFVLFTNCIVTVGKTRSTIADLQNASHYYISNKYAKALNDLNDKKISEVVCEIDEPNEFTDFLVFLSNSNFGTFTNNPECFPNMSTEWDEPSIYTNSIVDWNYSSDYNLISTVDKLINIGIKDIQLRIYELNDISILQELINHIKYSRLISLEIILPFTTYLDIDILERYTVENRRLKYILIHSMPAEVMAQIDLNVINSANYKNLVFTDQTITSSSHCGEISALYFTYNIKLHTEGRKFNTCLNRKLSIDLDGNIKNCPSMTESYGHIKDANLKSLAYNDNFTQYWAITKDVINECNICEHRVFCTDCRAYTVKNEKFGKPIKCKYNPHTGEWLD